MKLQLVFKKLIIIFFLFIIIMATAISASAENGKYVIILDPGHGGVDGGTNTGIRLEKEYDLIIANYLKAELEKNPNFEVHLTRVDDSYIKYLPRALEIINHNADILISLHCNSNTATYVKGCDAYISVVDEYNGWTLADKILTAISNAVPINKGRVHLKEDTGDSLGIYYWNYEKKWDMPGAWQLGKKSDYYSMSTWSSKFGVSSIIIEHGYLSNASDRVVLDSDANLRAIAKAEAGAIIEFFTGHTHTYTAEKVIDYPSSCTLNGTKSYRCTICGAKKDTETLPAAPNNHYFRQIESAKATCTTDGYIKYICQTSFNLDDKGYDCEVHYYTEKLAASGHNYVVVEDTQATHGSDGVKKTVCQNCGDTITEVRTADPHNYEKISETPPTCTENGGTTYRCTLCDDEYTDPVPASGHDFLVKEAKDATPEEDGYILYSCKVCGEEKTDVLTYCEHQFTTEETPPTCTENGSILYSCVKCKYVKTEDVPKLGHSYDLTEEEEATCTEDGRKTFTCSVCGNEASETIPATGHDYVNDPDRKKFDVCSHCGDEIPNEEYARKNTKGIILLSVCGLVIVAGGGAIAILIISDKKSRKRGRQ